MSHEGSGNIKKLFIATIVLTLCMFFAKQGNAQSFQMHTVKKGDTYFQVAKSCGVNLEELQEINKQSSQSMKVGSLIKVKPIKEINVMVNEQNITFDISPYIENENVFVPIRFVSEALKCDSIEWNQKTMTAEVKIGEKSINVTVGSDVALVNGKNVKLNAPVQFYDGRTFVPVRFFSETIGVDSINWISDSNTVEIKKSIKKEVSNKYSEEDLYWLSRIVEIEAGSQPLEGKIGVANVIINRKKSPLFPNTIKGVIFDTKYGVQFPPTKDGRINKTPSEESVTAAKKALEGYNNVGASLYFAEASNKSSWVAKNRKHFITIGNHAYYL